MSPCVCACVAGSERRSWHGESERFVAIFRFVFFCIFLFDFMCVCVVYACRTSASRIRSIGWYVTAATRPTKKREKKSSCCCCSEQEVAFVCAFRNVTVSTRTCFAFLHNCCCTWRLRQKKRCSTTRVVLLQLPPLRLALRDLRRASIEEWELWHPIQWGNFTFWIFACMMNVIACLLTVACVCKLYTVRNYWRRRGCADAAPLDTDRRVLRHGTSCVRRRVVLSNQLSSYLHLKWWWWRW